MHIYLHVDYSPPTSPAHTRDQNVNVLYSALLLPSLPPSPSSARYVNRTSRSNYLVQLMPGTTKPARQPLVSRHARAQTKLTSTGPLASLYTSTSRPTLVTFPLFSTPDSRPRCRCAPRLMRPLTGSAAPTASSLPASSSSSSSYAHASLSAPTVKWAEGI